MESMISALLRLTLYLGEAGFAHRVSFGGAPDGLLEVPLPPALQPVRIHGSCCVSSFL